MERIESRARRAGFTMLEVIVVMGIIGVLVAVMMPLLSGTRNSALTAQCKNNMKSLALGAISYAQGRSENDGHFPSAGFYRTLSFRKLSARSRGKGLSYYPERSWISNNGPIVDLNRTVNSVLIGTVVRFTDADEPLRTAITNGVVWKASGESYEVYRCPVHARAYEKANSGRLPGWSYMMNQEFGFNRDEKGVHAFMGASVGGNIEVSTKVTGVRETNSKKRVSRSPDKVLMFAEVQGVDVVDSKNGITLKPVSGSTETDAVLEYTKEDMGFNHPMGKGKYGGNVAFADGHVDTIILPTKMSRRDLTRYLCQGFDVPHDGRPYTPSTVDE